MNTETEKMVSDLRELTIILDDRIKSLTDNVVALEGAQYVILSALCLHDEQLKAGFSQALTRMVTRPNKSDNQRFEEFLKELLGIAKNPRQTLPSGGRLLH